MTYTAFAAVYSLPLLQHGLSFDGYVLACILACAAHVQVTLLVQQVGRDHTAVAESSCCSAVGRAAGAYRA